MTVCRVVLSLPKDKTGSLIVNESNNADTNFFVPYVTLVILHMCKSMGIYQ